VSHSQFISEGRDWAESFLVFFSSLGIIGTVFVDC